VPNWSLNNVTAPDAYSTAATLQNLPYPSRINLDVFNQGIYWQLQETHGTGTFTEATWGSETYMAPGSRTLLRSNVRGVRVRAAIAAANLPAGQSQAQFTLEAVL
jgi:hypothetical protein